MTGAHRAPLLILPALASVLAPQDARAQGEPPHIEFDMTVLGGRNPFLVTDDRNMNAAAEISATGGAVLGVDSKTTLDLDGKLAHRRYARRYGSFVTGNADIALDHRSSEHLALHSGLSYARVLPLEAQVASIDAAIDPVSLQERYQARQDVRWRPDALTTVIGRVTWDRIAPRNSQLLSQIDATSFALSYERRLSSTSWIGLSGLGTFSDSTDGSSSDSAILVVKAGTRLAQHLSVETEAGLSRIDRRETDRRRNRTPAQPTATVILCYDPRRLRVCLSGRVSPVVTSFGGIRREKALNATFSLQTGESGSLSAAADYRRAPGPTFGREASVLRLSSAYEHRLDRRFTLHAGLDFDRRTGMSRQPLDAWTVRVGVSFRIPSR